MKTTKREIMKLAQLWADSSGIPQTVYKREGEWRNTAGPGWDPTYYSKDKHQLLATVLPSFYFGFVDARMAKATATLVAMGLR